MSNITFGTQSLAERFFPVVRDEKRKGCGKPKMDEEFNPTDTVKDSAHGEGRVLSSAGGETVVKFVSGITITVPTSSLSLVTSGDADPIGEGGPNRGMGMQADTRSMSTKMHDRGYSDGDINRTRPSSDFDDEERKFYSNYLSGNAKGKADRNKNRADKDKK